MQSTTTRVGLTTLLMFALASAHAGSMSLVYVGDNDVTAGGTVLAAQGDELLFEVIADFRDHPTLGGGFDVTFDPNVLSYDSISWYGYYCKWHCDSFPDSDNGLLESLGFGDFHGIAGPAHIVRLSFIYVGDVGTSSHIALGPTNGIAGPFISAIDYTSVLDVDFHGVVVSNVPLPAAFWLLFAGCGAFIGLRTRFPDFGA